MTSAGRGVYTLATKSDNFMKYKSDTSQTQNHVLLNLSFGQKMYEISIKTILT